MKKLLFFTFLSSSIIWAGGRPSVEVEPPANLIDCPSSSDDENTLPSVPSAWAADESDIVESTPITRQIKRDREHEKNMQSYTTFLCTIFPILIVAALTNKLLDF